MIAWVPVTPPNSAPTSIRSCTVPWNAGEKPQAWLGAEKAGEPVRMVLIRRLIGLVTKLYNRYVTCLDGQHHHSLSKIQQVRHLRLTL